MLATNSGNGVKLSEFAREYVADPVAARVRSRELRITEENRVGGRENLILAVRKRVSRKSNKRYLAG